MPRVLESEPINLSSMKSIKKTLSVDKKKTIASSTNIQSGAAIGSSFIKVTTTFLKDEPAQIRRSSRNKSQSKSVNSSISKKTSSKKMYKIVKSGKSTPKSVKSVGKD